jgi:predicted ATPase
MEMEYPWPSESFTPGLEEPFAEDWFNNPPSKAHPIDVKYAFIHDKVQEACYDTIPDDQLPATHLNIGRNLREYRIHSDEVLFEVCNHIGAGHALLQDAERQEMATMNLHAARKAMTRAANEHALQYSLAARALSKSIGEDALFTLAVNQVLVQSMFSLAKYEDALKETEVILAGTTCELERVVIAVERVRALRSLGRNREAYEQGMKTIQSLGLKVPDDVWSVEQIMALTMEYKRGLDTEETIRVSPPSLLLT